MSDFGDAGQESTNEYTEPTAAPEAPTEDHSNQTTGAEPQAQEQTNPFWGEVEKLTGPNVYKTIQPHLAKADAEAHKRISTLNQSYSPWKQFVDQGITPEHVQQAIGVVQRLNDPNGQVEIFQGLQTFLDREGRLPTQAELQQEVEDEDDDVDPRDQQLAQLQEQQDLLAKFLQHQQQQEAQAQANAEADSWLEAELDRVKQSRPDFDAADLQEVVRIAAFQAQSGQEPNIAAAVEQFAALRDRIRTAPRPGQTAPRIPSGPGGGTPSAGGVDVSSLSKDQRRDMVAQMLQRNK